MPEAMLLQLNKKLYPEVSIRQGLAAYKDICPIALTENDQYHQLSFECNESSIPLEFSNYVLSTIRIKPKTP